MLIRFSAENFGAIRERQTLSLVATASSRTKYAFETGRSKPSHLLRVAAIFGPNAAGKTTLVRAVNALRKLVRKSHAVQKGEALDITPHLFGGTTSNPTRFEIAFIVESVAYEYGLALTKDKIIEEWLTRSQSSKRQLLFDRRAAAKGDYEFYFNPALIGRHKAWREETLENMLLLSKIVSFNNKQLSPVFDWFTHRLTPPIFRGTTSAILDFTNKQLHEGDQYYMHSVLGILRSLDLRIEGIKVSEQLVNLNLDEDFKQLFSPATLKVMADAKEFVPKFTHRCRNGELVDLNLEDESDGTQRLYSLVGPLLAVLQVGGVLFVDELHNSLHPLATKHLVSLFQNPSSNPNNGQLIFSTHDPTMLRGDVLHRDQIWFMERSREDASRLVALSEFRERSDVHYEDRYLSGRYGGLPLIYEQLTGLPMQDEEQAPPKPGDGKRGSKKRKKQAKASRV